MYISTPLLLVDKVSFYSDAVESLPEDPTARVRLPVGDRLKILMLDGNGAYQGRQRLVENIFALRHGIGTHECMFWSP